jgi:hypothetical protein
VATFESGWRQMDRLGNRFELVIVDEAHHFGSGVRDEVLELCAAPARLGLTATPPSGAAAERIEELIGPTVFNLKIDGVSVDALTGTCDLRGGTFSLNSGGTTLVPMNVAWSAPRQPGAD